MVEAFRSKSTGKSTAGTKRPATKSNTKAPRKRQKSSMAAWLGMEIPNVPVQPPVQEQEPEPEPGKPQAIEKDQVFRFMDLPGELRNRVYEYAAKTSSRNFPHTFVKPKKRSKRSKSKPTLEEEDRRPPLKPLPYIGLTQVCTQIRMEFRPLWLSSHRFPLYVLNDYIKAFFPAPLRLKQTTEDVKRRIASYIDPKGKLEIRVNRHGLIDMDIRPILKFQARFPAYKLSPSNATPNLVSEETMASLTLLMKNATPLWTKYLRGNITTQVRIRADSARNDNELHIVIKEQCAPLWMKRNVHPRVIPEGYLASLGLDGLSWEVSFGVDYS